MSNTTPGPQRHGHDPQSLADVAFVAPIPDLSAPDPVDDALARRRAEIATRPPTDDVPAWIAPDGHDYGPGRCTVCGGPLNDDTDPAVWPCQD